MIVPINSHVVGVTLSVSQNTGSTASCSLGIQLVKVGGWGWNYSYKHHALYRYTLQNPKITCYDVYDVAIMATTASGPLIPELADPTLITLELDNLETNQLHVAEITGVQTSGSRTALISECYTMLFITSLENVCVASWELPCIGSAKLIRVLQSTS